MKKTICLLALSMLFFYSYGYQPFYSLALGSGDTNANTATQYINFGGFTNNYVDHSSSQYHLVSLLTAGLLFDLKHQLKLRLGLQWQSIGAADKSGLETVGINSQTLNYQFKYKNNSLFLNSELQLPLTNKLAANFIAKIGLAHNKAYNWQATPTDETTGAGSSFSANTSNQFAWGIGAGIAYQIQRFNLSLDDIYVNLGKVSFGTQANQLTTNTYSLDNIYSNQILLTLEYS